MSVINLWYGIVGSLGLFRSQVPIVNISSGPVQGVIAQSRGGVPYFKYMGIPYARSKRFEVRFLTKNSI